MLATFASEDRQATRVRDGAMGVLIGAHDWSTSPLGPSEDWPQPLKTLVDVMLGSSQPMFVAWGPGRTLLYNDSYAEVLASKHPSALGRDFLDAWHEIRADLQPIVAQAYAGRPVQMADIMLVMERKGYPEETHFSFSYTPVRDEVGTVAGFFCPCVEITGQVLAERRQAFRLSLEERLRDRADPRDTMAAAVELLGRHLGANRAGYGEVQADDATVVLHACYADGVEPLEGAFPLDGFGPAMIARQRRGLTQASNDVAIDPEQDLAVWAAIDTRAFASVPLVRDERFTASLYVNFREPHHWTAEELTLIEEVAARTWSAVEGAQAEQRLRESEARLAFLDRLGAATAPLADADVVLATTTRLVGEHLGLSVCAYADMDEDQDGFTIRGDWAAAGAQSIVGHYSLADFGKLAVTNLSAGRPLVVNDNLQELAPQEAATFQGIGIAATICMPLVKEGRLVALMAIHDRVPRLWTEAELSLLRAVTARSWAHVERVAATAELRESEARLRETSRRLNAVLDNANVSIFLINDEHQCIYMNPAAERLTGYTLAETQGRHLHDIVHHTRPDGRPYPAHECPIDGVSPTSGRQRGEEVFIDKGGRFIPVRFAASAIHDDSGAPVGTIVEVQDITDQKVAEAGLRELTDTLERRVRERTAELVQAQEALRQSQKLESIGQLTGGVAHDFNNLLTPIIGSLDMLQRKKLGGTREQRLIDGAIQSAERAKTLVQRLLAFARRQPLQPEPVDLGALVSGMADLVASTTGPQIKVVVDIADDLPAAIADPNQVEMAILNLAVNARDAMEDGGTLRISAESETIDAEHHLRLHAGCYIRLSVADTGTGMDEEILEKAVEPFFSTKGVGRGTGLGLSMVHGLAAQLGGALTIKSRPGLGTSVEIWLPASAASVDETPTLEATRLPFTAVGTALLVDDEELVRMSTADMLVDAGYEVVEASSAEEALTLVDGGLAPDLLVTDHLMPGMTGTELARELRTRRPTMQVLVVSGYAEVDGVAPDLPRLVKPFRQADLAAKLCALD